MKTTKTALELAVEEELREAGRMPERKEGNKEPEIEATRKRIEYLAESYKKERAGYKEVIKSIEKDGMYSSEYKEKKIKQEKEKASNALVNFKVKVDEIINHRLEQLEKYGLEKAKKTEMQQLIEELRKQNLYIELETAGKDLEIKEIVRRLEGLDETTIKISKTILGKQGIDTVPIELAIPHNKQELTEGKLYELQNHIRRITDGIDQVQDNPVYEAGLMGLEYSLRYLDNDLNYID